MPIEYLGLFIALISFMGFWVENIWIAVTKGYIDNRNFRLPFLLGYGLFVVGFTLCFETPDNVQLFGIKTNITGIYSRILYFISAFAVICAGEHILGKFVEKLCGFAYWDYDNVPLKLSKYTSIPTSIAFAFMVTFFMDYYARPIAEFFMRIDIGIAKGLSIIILLILSIDFIFSFSKMIRTRRLNELWRVDLRKEQIIND